MTVRIETPRLILRRPVMSDLDAIHNAKVKVWPELQKWMSWAYDGQAELNSTRSFITDYKTAICGFDKETGSFVVSSGCDPTDTADEYATGYWVAEEYLGKGYATESTTAVLRYAFGKLNAKAVHIEHYEGNDKSRSVIEKSGFQYVRTDAKSHKRCSDGTPLDALKYAIYSADKLPELEVTWS